MLEQCAEHALIAGEAAGAAPGRAHERLEIRRRAVGERIAFRVTPDELDRIEFGRVGRQEFHAHAGMGDQPALDEFAAMCVAAIPDDRRGRADQPRQVPKKGAHANGVEARIGRETKQTADAVPTGRNHQGRDDRDFLSRPAALVQDRRLAPRRPRAADERGNQHARLINEDQRGLAARGVFFTTGQRAFTHWAMAASSRSIARRAGCCGLQPKAWRTRPT